MVVFADGRPLKRDYRRFQIRTLDHADDLRALEEVLERRFRRYLDGDEHFAPLPDLLLMDGGQLQAESACRVLERLGLTVPVLGMVKDDRHRTRALVTAEGQELGIQQSPRCSPWWARSRRRSTASPLPITMRSTRSPL